MSADSNPNKRDFIGAGNELLQAQAFLSMYINQITDDRADERYVLWTIQEKIKAAYDKID